jgi:hypothetical protein
MTGTVKLMNPTWRFVAPGSGPALSERGQPLREATVDLGEARPTATGGISYE